MKIGIVGYSRSAFNHVRAYELLEEAVVELLKLHTNLTQIEIVSGLTNQGVPKLAYEFADARGFRTIGISPKRALKVRAGVYPVDHQIIEGEDFGDESDTFIEYIDAMIRIGGGPQSRHEVEMFQAKCKQLNWEVEKHLIEKELGFGKKKLRNPT